MTDFARALRGALDGEAATAAAPPFDGMVRRHRQRRARRGVAVAAAAVLVAGGVAVAVPRGGGAARLRPAATPSLKSSRGLAGDRAAELAIGACMAAHGFPVPTPTTGVWELRYGDITYSDGDPKWSKFPQTFNDCFAASGYEGGLDTGEAGEAEARRQRDCREATSGGKGTVVGSGVYRGKPWAVNVATATIGFCVRETYDGELAGSYVGDVSRHPAGTPPGPSLRDSLLKDEGFVFVGGLDPAVVTVDAVVDGVAIDGVRTVAVPGIDDRVFYAFVARVADSNHYDFRLTPRDADGNVVAASPRSGSR